MCGVCGLKSVSVVDYTVRMYVCVMRTEQRVCVCGLKIVVMWIQLCVVCVFVYVCVLNSCIYTVRVHVCGVWEKSQQQVGILLSANLCWSSKEHTMRSRKADMELNSIYNLAEISRFSDNKYSALAVEIPFDAIGNVCIGPQLLPGTLSCIGRRPLILVFRAWSREMGHKLPYNKTFIMSCLLTCELARIWA